MTLEKVESKHNPSGTILHTTLQFTMCCTCLLSRWTVYSHPIMLDIIQFDVLDSAVHKNQLGSNRANTI